VGPTAGSDAVAKRKIPAPARNGSATKAYWGSGGRASGRDQLKPDYPLDSRQGGPQRRSGRGSEEKKSHHCPGWELKPGRPACSIVPILTEMKVIRILDIGAI
jgi:hypothetical protein